MIKPTLTQKISHKLMAAFGALFGPKDDESQPMSQEAIDALQKQIHQKALTKCQKWMAGYPAIVEVRSDDRDLDDCNDQLYVTILPIRATPDLINVTQHVVTINDTYLWDGHQLFEFNPVNEWDLDQNAHIIFK